MDGQPDQTADQRAVDPDILEIATDGIFKSARHRTRVPAPHGFADQFHDAVTVTGRCADGRAAGEAVNERFKALVALQRIAKLLKRFTQAARDGCLRITGSPKEAGARLA